MHFQVSVESSEDQNIPHRTTVSARVRTFSGAKGTTQPFFFIRCVTTPGLTRAGVRIFGGRRGGDGRRGGGGDGRRGGGGDFLFFDSPPPLPSPAAWRLHPKGPTTGRGERLLDRVSRRGGTSLQCAFYESGSESTKENTATQERLQGGTRVDGAPRCSSERYCCEMPLDSKS